MMLSRPSLVPGAALAAVVAAGCGSGSGSDQVREAFNQVRTAVGAGDAASVCSLLGPRAREQIGEIGHGSTDCTTAMRPVLETLTRRGSSAIASSAIADVEIKTTAVAQVEVDGRTIRVPFVKDGDSWRVDSFFGLRPERSVAIP